MIIAVPHVHVMAVIPIVEVDAVKDAVNEVFTLTFFEPNSPDPIDLFKSLCLWLYLYFGHELS